MLCILIPFLVGLICAILGYLIGKLSSNNKNNTVDINVFKNRIAMLEADLEACKASKQTHTGIASGAGNGGLGSNMMASNIVTPTATAAATSAIAFNADAA